MSECLNDKLKLILAENKLLKESEQRSKEKIAELESQLQQTEISITDNEINDMIRDIQMTDVEITVLELMERIGEQHGTIN